MKNKKKIAIIFMLCASVLFCLLTSQVSAVDNETEDSNSVQTPSEPTTTPEENITQETPNTTPEESITQETPAAPDESNTNYTPSNSGTTYSSPTQTTQTTGTSNINTTTKSSNADLSNLGITPNDFKGFTSATTSYEVTVPEDTEEIEVYASAQNANATITGTGKKTLEKGENKVEVIVTAEDGTQKTYTINIIREVVDEQEETENKEEGKGLTKLTISGLSLSPEFKTNIYEYTVKYIGEDEKLEIEAKPTDENYIVEIIGNEDLQEGENTITILVSEKDGNNIATYQITVNKSLVDEEAIAREATLKREKQRKMILVGAIIVVVAAAVVGFVVVKRKNNNNNNNFEEDLYDDYSDDEDEYEEELEEDREAKKEKLKAKLLNNYSSEEENQNSQKDYKEGYDTEFIDDKMKKQKGKRYK
jgi:hypothetical protein